MSPCHTTLAALALALCACTTQATDATVKSSSTSDLKPFPAPLAGEIRHVIELPPLADEDLRKVELIAGKTLEVDCNRHRLGGRWEEKTIEGWGYSYHRLDQVGPPMSTLMACPDNSRRKAFVAVGGEPLLLRYNSKLPLVVYVPQDVEVRYRIWSAPPDSLPAPSR
ncbi:serine protease inhibitor ecotin [Azonexus sp.]|uniref:serine protease inhibitor ecotin n=1 Tax=Azonexus sp. TaxID=1872668 RepID=UPI0039E23734